MRPNNLSLIKVLVIVSVLTLLSCVRHAGSDCFRDADFNAGWYFHMGDISDPFAGGDEPGWVPVHLPHDWSILDYELQDSLHEGPFYKNLPGGVDVGYLRNGTAWYRKEFVSPGDSGDKQIMLSFDGVQSHMELWVNGIFIGEHVYGYTPFLFDIAPALKPPGEKNVIAVKTVNPGENSRWFSGAGIYRSVKLSVLHSLAMAPWGVYVTTPEVSADRASIHMEIEVSNRRGTGAEVSGEILIHSPDNREFVWKTDTLIVGPGLKETLIASGFLDQPYLWTIDEPCLYQVEVSLLEAGQETDSYSTRFGIRSIAYSANDGFLLNGEELLMKGACMHHDNGLLGAAAFKDAEYRRVKRMKENGYNAIRTSHNPPSEFFLDACDELGVVVIDESFDQWEEAKRPNDYSNYFKEWHIRDIQAMVYRDRNHPSVVMWSFGNEVRERADPEGIEIGKILSEAIREVDDTRPLTQAVCAFWDQPGREWDYSEGAFSMLDISGYNYQFTEYEPDHAKFPERIIYGSETFPKYAWENWELVKRHPWVTGDFVWTGMDYIGESGIGHDYFFDPDMEREPTFLMPWPWYVSWCGDLDILGNKKPQSLYRDVLWGESKLEILVSTPVPEGQEPWLSNWGWHDELPHWNWKGHEGKAFRVKVYSSFPEVRLELNGVIIGSKTLDSADRYTAEFELPYASGELKAIGIQGGKEMETKILLTSGDASELFLEAEKDQIAANRNSLVFINVSSLDVKGQSVLNHEPELRVDVAGPVFLMAAGNASPEHQGSFTDEVFDLFRGKGMVILRSTGKPGEIVVEVSSEDLKPARLTLHAE
ncbi:MAG: glycoside hydrolase family 2 TIM barrel-domain containing protein [Bacteroidales bacterium]|nr:glycoside hydrolase family 2 TIM barrel-domain containing protein [Bacteroidales bacterium]